MLCVHTRVSVCAPMCVLFPTIEAFVDDLSNYWPKALLDQRTELTGIWLCVCDCVCLSHSDPDSALICPDSGFFSFFGLFYTVFKNIVYSKYITVFIYLLLCAAHKIRSEVIVMLLIMLDRATKNDNRFSEWQEHVIIGCFMCIIDSFYYNIWCYVQ